jgi:Fe2+ or Zn2+ uptake regulation protein
MTHHVLHWEYVLNRAGHRVTRQREIILDAVCEGGGHKPFDVIYAAVQERDRSVDRSTVYRALHLFTELGLVVEAKSPGSETLYEMRKPRPHHHLICQRCGAEREVAGEIVDALAASLRERFGFRLASDHLLLFGTCDACSETPDIDGS